MATPEDYKNYGHNCVHACMYSSMQDRYAETRALPPIDDSQDWFLISAEEEGGFTILEFSRNLTTCDSKDLDIKVRIAIFRTML